MRSAAMASIVASLAAIAHSKKLPDTRKQQADLQDDLTRASHRSDEVRARMAISQFFILSPAAGSQPTSKNFASLAAKRPKPV